LLDGPTKLFSDLYPAKFLIQQNRSFSADTTKICDNKN